MCKRKRIKLNVPSKLSRGSGGTLNLLILKCDQRNIAKGLEEDLLLLKGCCPLPVNLSDNHNGNRNMRDLINPEEAGEERRDHHSAARGSTHTPVHDKGALYICSYTVHSYNSCLIFFLTLTKQARIQLKESHSKDQWGWIRPELSLQGRTIPTCSGATVAPPLRNNVALPVLKTCEFREASDPPHDDQRHFRSNTSSGLWEACGVRLVLWANLPLQPLLTPPHMLGNTEYLPFCCCSQHTHTHAHADVHQTLWEGAHRFCILQVEVGEWLFHRWFMIAVISELQEGNKLANRK